MAEKEIKKLREYFKKRKDVVMAFVFGSFAKGRQMKESDVDVAVYFKSEQENFKKEDEIWSDINKIIQNKEVHLVCLNNAPATLISDVFKTGIPLVIKDKKLYWELYLYKTLEAEDFVRFAEEYFEIAKKAKSLTSEQKTRLLEKWQFLNNEMKELKIFEELSFGDYTENKNKRRNIERWAENIINVSIDIAKILLASEKKDMPKTYEEALLKFGILASLNQQEAEKFSKFANLRNLLAHEYLDILYKRIQVFIKEFPPLYQKIYPFLEKYLKNNKKDL
ncbi:DUF86 domain-containing protein [Patescibacteria group bacterium]|nr:DUF86 domain-containing protein [Patescibacteria group bacterium]